MREFIINNEQSGKKVVRILTTLYPTVPAYIFQKALRNKDLMLGGKRLKNDVTAEAGQTLRIYVKDEVLAQASDNTDRKNQLPSYTVVYEDKNIILINKPQGLTVHPGKNTPPHSTLIEKLRADYNDENLTLCHRLDRNTGGLVLVAKNKVTLGKINEALAEQQVIKRYRCLVRGIPDIGRDVYISDGDSMHELNAFWEKPANSDEVFIHDEQQADDLPICTRYRVLHIFTALATDGEPISELEVELVTGRTHQIRAHLAHIGHPILGDGKYGRNEFNSQFKNKHGGKLNKQQLFATTLMFGNDLPAGLTELKRRTFKISPDYTVSGL